MQCGAPGGGNPTPGSFFRDKEKTAEVGQMRLQPALHSFGRGGASLCFAAVESPYGGFCVQVQLPSSASQPSCHRLCPFPGYRAGI